MREFMQKNVTKFARREFVCQCRAAATVEAASSQTMPGFSRASVSNNAIVRVTVASRRVSLNSSNIAGLAGWDTRVSLLPNRMVCTAAPTLNASTPASHNPIAPETRLNQRSSVTGCGIC